MKKRKIKKQVKYYLYGLLLGIIIIIPLLFIKTNKTNNYSYIDKILELNINNIDKDFLNWIKDNYGENKIEDIYMDIKLNDYSDNIWHNNLGYTYKSLQDIYNNTNINIINKNTISFIGDVSLADNWYIMKSYDERNKGLEGILSKDTIDYMNNTGLLIVNNEFTISSRGEPLSGKTYTFRASKERLQIYNDMGVDLVTLANNHVYDYGTLAFNDMLDSLDEYNIPHIGAGKDLEEASIPYYTIVNGYKIGFVNANRSEKNIYTPGATDTSEGVLRCYDPEYFENLIKETKENCDYVVALIHWGKEDSHELEQVQKDTSRLYIDSGADLIIGTHAHVLQGMEFYNNKLIVYNLGDFIFNNETKDTGIFTWTIEDNNFKYQFIPAIQNNMYTSIQTEDNAISILNKIKSWSININIDNNGYITEAK